MNNAEESVTFAIVWCDETLFRWIQWNVFDEQKKALRNENRFFRVDTNDGEARKRKKRRNKERHRARKKRRKCLFLCNKYFSRMNTKLYKCYANTTRLIFVSLLCKIIVDFFLFKVPGASPNRTKQHEYLSRPTEKPKISVCIEFTVNRKSLSLLLL